MVTKIDTFPYKLYNMLSRVSACDSAEEAASVAWLPTDNGFLIINQDAFLEHIIPVYFNMTQLRSFTRQLNLWGFTRDVSKSNQTAWCHPHFVRNDMSQLQHMIRTPIKYNTNRSRQASVVSKKLKKEAALAGDDKIVSASSLPANNGIAGLIHSDWGSVQTPAASMQPPINMFTLDQPYSYYPDQSMSLICPKPIRMKASSTVSLEPRSDAILSSELIQSRRVSSDDNSPIYFMDEMMPQVQRDAVSDLAGSYNDETNNVSCEASEEEWLQHSNLGIGNDSYVAERQLGHKGTPEELEDAKSSASCPQQDSDIADVSDIDFNAFVSRYFPSEMGC